MKALTTSIAVLCCVGAAAAQRRSPTEAALVQELKGLATAKTRTDEELTADDRKLTAGSLALRATREISKHSHVRVT